MSDINKIADILVKHRGSLDTSELTRLTAAQEILDATQTTITELTDIIEMAESNLDIIIMPLKQESE